MSQVLQKLGKADETKDEQFEQVVINFRRQEVRKSHFSGKVAVVCYLCSIRNVP